MTGLFIEPADPADLPDVSSLPDMPGFDRFNRRTIFSTWREGWKVVRRARNNWLRSCTDEGESTWYRLGKLTIPRDSPFVLCGPLSVFVDLESAAHFARIWIRGPVYIYRCLYAPSTSRRLWVQNAFNTVSRLRVWNFPPGTDFADAVVLLEKEMDGPRL